MCMKRKFGDGMNQIELIKMIGRENIISFFSNGKVSVVCCTKDEKRSFFDKIMFYFGVDFLKDDGYDERTIYSHMEFKLPIRYRIVDGCDRLVFHTYVVDDNYNYVTLDEFVRAISCEEYVGEDFEVSDMDISTFI